MSLNSPLRNGELEAELLRNVLDTATHDLGGLGSALALRADVMQRSAPSAAATACSAIATELRSLGGQLRAISDPRGGGALSPAPLGSLQSWLSLISRFGQPLVGRGVVFNCELDDARVSSTAAYELTYIVLAVLHALRESETPAHTEVRLSSELGAGAVTLRMSMHNAVERLTIADILDDGWWLWAVERASSAQIGLQISDGQVDVLVDLEASA